MEQTICVFGDSIAWGAYDPQHGGWVNKLQRYFQKHYDDDIIIYNQGVSGDNTEDLSLRFENECKAREPQTIIFAIGINDSQYIKNKNNPRISIEIFERNLRELIDKAKNFSDQILFIGITKVDESKVMPIPWSDEEKFYDNENIEQYNEVIKKISTEYGVPFLNIFNLLENSDLYDGLHPNTNGHEKMFLEIKNFLLKNLKTLLSKYKPLSSGR